MALVGGIDVSSSGSIPILVDNGVPQIGGIPATLDEQTEATEVVLEVFDGVDFEGFDLVVAEIATQLPSPGSRRRCFDSG